MKECIINIEKGSSSYTSLSKIESVIGEAIDLLYHFNDIFNQQREIFSIKLSDILLKALILPILGGTLIAEKFKSYHISIPVSLLILSHMIYIFNYIPLLESLISIIFDDKICNTYYDAIITLSNRDSPQLEKSDILINNPISDNIYHFLKSKEDNLSGLTLHIVQAALINTPDLLLKKDNPDENSNRFINFMNIFKDIIMLDAEIRFFTYYLTSKLILDLSRKINNEPNLLEIEIIKNALQKYAQSTLLFLNSTQSPMYTVKIFEEEWDYIKKINWSEKIELPLNYILPTIDEISFNIPLEHRRCLTEDNQIQYMIKLFLMYRKLKNLILPLKNSEGVDPDIFTLYSLNTCNLKQGESYHWHSGYLKEKKIIKAIIRGLGFNNNIEYIIEDSNFIILSHLVNGNNTLVIDMTIRFSKISIQDASDINIIMIIIDQKNPLMLLIENDSASLYLRNHLAKRTKECKDNDFRLLKSFIQEIIRENE